MVSNGPRIIRDYVLDAYAKWLCGQYPILIYCLGRRGDSVDGVTLQGSRQESGGQKDLCGIGYCATLDGLIVIKVTGKDPTPGILNIL